MTQNETMMQYFEWYLPNDGVWWRRCAEKAQHLSELGITEVWLPPAYKGISQDDVGYAVYDLYDLGEFDQKETVRTKYGTREEYQEAIRSFHSAGIRVFADIVLNHRMGGDEIEEVAVVTDAADNRNLQVGGKEYIKVWSKFTFPGRAGKYSDFVWNHNHFSGTDYAEDGNYDDRIFRFANKRWARDTDKENGNFDYLMGMNVDVRNPEVVEELQRWLSWYIYLTDLDGLRLDAVKHISFEFYRDFLPCMREKTGRELPAVGEYWSGDVGSLLNYLDQVQNAMSLFDVALHYNFYNGAKAGGSYDMRQIFDNTLVKERPAQAVTFVDNHDTQYGQSLQSFIDDWFKPLAYSIILLRDAGTPCVFYSDYYGNPVQDRPMVPCLGKMIKVRHLYAYGEQEDYFDDPHVVGWVRRGEVQHENSGLAVLMSNGEGGSKRMYIGREFAGETFCDCIGKCQESVTIDEEGFGLFATDGGNVAVWLRKAAFEHIMITE